MSGKKRRWILAASWGGVFALLFVIAAVVSGEADTRAKLIAVGLFLGLGLACLIGFSNPGRRDR